MLLMKKLLNRACFMYLEVIVQKGSWYFSLSPFCVHVKCNQVFIVLFGCVYLDNNLHLYDNFVVNWRLLLQLWSSFNREIESRNTSSCQMLL